MGIAHLQPIAFCLVGFLKSTKIEQGDFGLGILAIQDWGDLLKMFVYTEGTIASENTSFCWADQTKPSSWFTF